jgi:Dolichyl-phosphate-mannose-protein mannosyltransferase
MHSPDDQQRKSTQEPGSAPISRWKCWVGLLLILLLGACLRFHRITELEPGIWDEGCYFLEARYFSSFSRAVWDSAKLFLEEKRSSENLWKKEEQLPKIREQVRGLPPRYGRILHDTFLAVGNLLAGESPHTGNVVNAIFGTLTILGIFFLGRTMYDDRIGLYAALIFSVMGYHIHYSRSWLAEADTMFFLVLAFTFYYRSRCRFPALSQKDLALCGLFLGIGFTVHNRCVVILALILFLELLLLRKQASVPREVKRARILLLLAFFLLPSFLCESFYHLIFIICRRLQIVMTTPTYLEQVMYGFWHSLLWGYISENFRLAGFLTFPYLYQHMNGLLALLLLGAGLALAAWRRCLADRILVAWFVFPFVLYSLSNAGLTRFFCLILAPAAILSAAVFLPTRGTGADASSWTRGAHAYLRPAVLVLLVVTGVFFSWTRVLPPASGYATAMAFVKGQSTTKQIATGEPLCQVYVGVDQVKRPPESMEALEALYRQGFRYYVIDFYRILYTYYQMDRVEVMDQVQRRLDPVFSTANAFILRPQNIYEGNLYFWKTRAMMNNGPEQGLDRIRIYDLEEYFGED